MKIHVIASGIPEAKKWIMERYNTQSISLQDYPIVLHGDQLRGTENPHGVFLKGWLQNPNIGNILEQLVICYKDKTLPSYKVIQDMMSKYIMAPQPLCNLQPSVILIKNRNAVGGWHIYDTNTRTGIDPSVWSRTTGSI